MLVRGTLKLHMVLVNIGFWFQKLIFIQFDLKKAVVLKNLRWIFKLYFNELREKLKTGKTG